MHIYYFFKNSTDQTLATELKTTENILSAVAQDTDTNDLVVTIYFLRRCRWIGGTAIVKKWLAAADLTTKRGRWKFTQAFLPPETLPSRYKLVRLVFDLDVFHYPIKQQDTYGWIFQYHSFNDHLAFIFAHELHHFRRYHLGLHKGEGEHSANQWALRHVTALGFSVTGSRIKQKKTVRRKKFLFNKFDPYKKFRQLTSSSQLLIHYDPRGRYTGELATVVKPVRSHSKRIVVQTSDGKIWRWPMEWLSLL